MATCPHPDPLPQAGEGEETKGGSNGNIADETALAALVDRLGNRLGLANLCRLTPHESHLPERAVAVLPPLEAPGKGASGWPAGPPRPIRLLARPEPVEVTAPVPDDPPVLFRWRRLLHRVRRADGPERIAGEWWRASDPAARLGDPDGIRDYYRVEDETGRRFWLYPRRALQAGPGGTLVRPWSVRVSGKKNRTTKTPRAPRIGRRAAPAENRLGALVSWWFTCFSPAFSSPAAR